MDESLQALLEQLGSPGFADLGFARVDTDREARQGAPEAIMAEGKTPAEIEAIARALEDLRRADCVVVVAGWDAALASVVGGLVAAPVIGVPTSTGYGATFGGVSALLAMLTSCAAGVAVVNIDDGFGAGTIAARIARQSA